MAGVIVVAVGIPDLFTSVREGEDFHVGVMVTGYVIMRVGVVAMWLRAAHDGTPPRNIGHVVTFAMPVVAMVLAAVGWPLWACLLIVLISPLSVIVFYETFEWRLLADRLDVVIDDAADAR